MAPEATIEQLTRVHPQGYVDAILGIRPPPGELVHIDADTVMSAGSANAARHAAGAVVAAVDGVLGGTARTAFAAVRPPGHHATPDVPGGFCLFNNVAIGARHAQAAFAIERVRNHRLRRSSRPGNAGRRRAGTDALLRLDAPISLYPGTELPARARHCRLTW